MKKFKFPHLVNFKMNIEARFYKTYEICGIIDEIIRDPVEHLQKLEAFYCDDQWIYLAQPYGKYSVLHKFIEFILGDIHAEQAFAVDLDNQQTILQNFRNIPTALRDFQPTKLPIELAFDYYEIEYDNFEEYLKNVGKNFDSADSDDIYEYMNELWLIQPYQSLVEIMVNEIFHILFQNRELLLILNLFLSNIIKKIDINEVMEKEPHLFKVIFKQDYSLKRIQPPAWAKKAVFFRDRGQCVLCNKDLSGLVNLANTKNFDHIVPLSLYGLNDITNLQLLCMECNQHDKRDNIGYTSNIYQSWYPYKRS